MTSVSLFANNELLFLFHFPLSHTLTLTYTSRSSHAFPCSGPGCVSPYFLSWLQAVSFFRSCTYPLGKLTSSEQGIINSISTLFPEKICFHCASKTSFSLCCCLVSPHDICFKPSLFSKRSVWFPLKAGLVSVTGNVNPVRRRSVKKSHNRFE